MGQNCCGERVDMKGVSKQGYTAPGGANKNLDGVRETITKILTAGKCFISRTNVVVLLDPKREILLVSVPMIFFVEFVGDL